MVVGLFKSLLSKRRFTVSTKKLFKPKLFTEGVSARIGVLVLTEIPALVLLFLLQKQVDRHTSASDILDRKKFIPHFTENHRNQ